MSRTNGQAEIQTKAIHTWTTEYLPGSLWSLIISFSCHPLILKSYCSHAYQSVASEPHCGLACFSAYIVCQAVQVSACSQPQSPLCLSLSPLSTHPTNLSFSQSVSLPICLPASKPLPPSGSLFLCLSFSQFLFLSDSGSLSYSPSGCLCVLLSLLLPWPYCHVLSPSSFH